MSGNSKPARRCAVYTRKSSEEGLQQDFNSLNAQREACEAYIRSQEGEGWRLVKTAYDDGGISGGTIDRPALQRLLADIKQGLIDIVVVYKVDRLTRSLMDFAKIVEQLDRHGASFVAVTQQFNTSTSMGRLTLNVLLSFAQFEREVTAERIRDKIAASKRKGMWMGGNLPLGYDVENRKLIVNKEEAKTVKLIYQRYLELGCVRLLQQDLEKRGIRSKVRVSREGRRSGGQAFSRGALYTLLANPIYVGEVRHKTAHYEGQHDAILDRELWQAVQQQLAALGTARKGITGKSSVSPLAGKLYDEVGRRLVPSHTVKKGRRYRYYVSQKLVEGSERDADPAWRLPAPEVEAAISAEIAKVMEEPATVASLATHVSHDRRSAQELMQRVKSYGDQLKNEDTRAKAMGEVIDRVEIGRDAIRLDLSATVLLPNITLAGEDRVIRREVALKLKRRGVETRLVIGGIDHRSSVSDPALVKLLSRALSWWEQITRGASSIERIAKTEKLSNRYVRDILQMAFLSPELVEKIVSGKHAENVSWNAMMSHPILPLAWVQQVGFFEARRATEYEG